MFSPNQKSKFYYPDGMVSVGEPTEGQVFFLWGTNAIHPKEVWQWDSKQKQWLDVTASSGLFLINEENDSFNLVEEFERMVKEGNKCECGSEAVGSNRHSSWCKKWSADH